MGTATIERRRGGTSEPPQGQRQHTTHALFPRLAGSGPETREIGYVRVERVNDRGVRETAPRLFPAEELPNL